MVRLRLRELATARGLNLSQVQRRAGLTMGMTRRYWYNETTQVDLRAVDVLARLLEVKPGELFTDEPEEPIAPSSEPQRGRPRKRGDEPLA
jgi:transcriptional regulator with XRE-family HTH domain